MNDGDIKKRKLILKRETVMPLQSVEVGDVVGGTGLFCKSVQITYEGVKVIANLGGAYQAVRGANELLRNNNGGGGRDPLRSRFRMTGGDCV